MTALRIRFPAALCVLLALSPSASRAQNGAHPSARHDEHIVMPKFPAGWIEQTPTAGAVEIVEYLPHDQTEATWREKITLEIDHNSTTLPIDAFQRRALAQLRETCTGVIEGKLQTGVNNGFPSAFWILGCKQDKRGTFGELRYTKAVQGKEAMYLLSQVWRTPVYPDGTPPVTQQQADEAVAFLSSAVVCADSADHPCPAAAK